MAEYIDKKDLISNLRYLKLVRYPQALVYIDDVISAIEHFKASDVAPVVHAHTVTKIPVPSIILKGDWDGVVYSIDTACESVDAHNIVVEQGIKEIMRNFDSHEHYSVSLREVKRELVFADDRVQRYCTLVQFRVRDSY